MNSILSAASQPLTPTCVFIPLSRVSSIDLPLAYVFTVLLPSAYSVNRCFVNRFTSCLGINGVPIAAAVMRGLKDILFLPLAQNLRSVFWDTPTSLSIESQGPNTGVNQLLMRVTKGSRCRRVRVPLGTSIHPWKCPIMPTNPCWVCVHGVWKV